MVEDYYLHEQQTRDAQAASYESFIPDYQHAREWAFYSSKMERWTGPILDVGCGTGRFARRLLAGRPDVFGVDFSLASLTQAQQRCADLRLCAADVRRLPFRDGIAGGVLSAQVLEHLLTSEDAQALFCEISRVLRPEGQAVISTYAFSWWDRMLRRKADRRGPGVRFVRYSRAEIRRFVLKAGLEVRGLANIVLFTRRPFRWVTQWLSPRALIRAEAVLAFFGQVWGALTVVLSRKRLA